MDDSDPTALWWALPLVALLVFVGLACWGAAGVVWPFRGDGLEK